MLLLLRRLPSPFILAVPLVVAAAVYNQQSAGALLLRLLSLPRVLALVSGTRGIGRGTCSGMLRPTAHMDAPSTPTASITFGCCSGSGSGSLGPTAHWHTHSAPTASITFYSRSGSGRGSGNGTAPPAHMNAPSTSATPFTFHTSSATSSGCGCV